MQVRQARKAEPRNQQINVEAHNTATCKVANVSQRRWEKRATRRNAQALILSVAHASRILTPAFAFAFAFTICMTTHTHIRLRTTPRAVFTWMPTLSLAPIAALLITYQSSTNPIRTRRGPIYHRSLASGTYHRHHAC